MSMMRGDTPLLVRQEAMSFVVGALALARPARGSSRQSAQGP
ncbi:hypothetical protein D187_006955 [Cystobacter fuscus DSM 2262]|uniref:Uncharacterized protein n=1 Tax=Cystobacter fuscus (strain ATCC 25194 / DSM 2262 / NBRC 100088 / M29) TaxID=1242864 RepID=S9P254_CYSF2|nr:hypothetical protein D187_006955 [Cystobacter fuscus DSM 2262]